MKRLEVIEDGVSSRREFCAQACHAAALAALGLVLPGCGGNSSGPSGVGAPALPTLSTSLAGGAFALTIDSASPLNTVGSAALVNASGRTFLVARTGETSFSALTATCTHEACTITGYQDQVYVCPCHGSRFTTAGIVVGGPAPRPLPTFATTFSNGLLMVTTG